MLIIVLVVLGVLNALTLGMTFLMLAAAGRVSLNQRLLVDTIRERYNESVSRLEELTEQVENALDCMVTLDARAAESSEEDHAA